MSRTALCDRVQARLPELSRRMVQQFGDEVPFYRRLPAEQLTGEISALCMTSLVAFLAALREDRGLTVAELEANRASAALRAQESVPLEALLAAYLIGVRLAWSVLVEIAEPDEVPELLGMVDGVQLYIQRVTGAVTSAYVEEQQLMAGAERNARTDLARAMLAGTPFAAAAVRAGVDVRRPWLVLAAVLPEVTVASGTDAVVAGRRCQRQLLQLLDAMPGPVLPVLDPQLALVLLDPASDVEALARELNRICGRRVAVGVTSSSDEHGVAAAGRLARELAEIGPLGPARVATLARLALEYQLTRPGPAREELSACLTPLQGRPELTLTLQAYLHHDLDRQSTARSLHVHPNTLDNRLARIAQLTGQDASTTQGLLRLAAALIAAGSGSATGVSHSPGQRC